MFLILVLIFAVPNLAEHTLEYQECKSRSFKGDFDELKSCKEIFKAKTGNFKQYEECRLNNFEGYIIISNDCTDYEYLYKYDKNK